MINDLTFPINLFLAVTITLTSIVCSLGIDGDTGRILWAIFLGFSLYFSFNAGWKYEEWREAR